VNILEVSAVELAKVLTLADYKLFKRLGLTELHQQVWFDQDVLSPNLLALIARFNLVSYWAATEIVLSSQKNRSKVVTLFINVMKAFHTLRNFNGIMQILSALNFGSVKRLEKSWKSVNSKSLTSLDEIEYLMSQDSNFGAYRKSLAEGIAVPFLGLILSDLVHIEESLDKVTTKTGRAFINFEKLGQISHVFMLVIQLQQKPLPLVENAEQIFEFLEDRIILTEEELMVASKAREPVYNTKSGKSRTSNYSTLLMRANPTCDQNLRTISATSKHRRLSARDIEQLINSNK